MVSERYLIHKVIGVRRHHCFKGGLSSNRDRVRVNGRAKVKRSCNAILKQPKISFSQRAMVKASKAYGRLRAKSTT